MAKSINSGIQQIGIGVKNVHEAWHWYHKYFGMDVKMFEEAASAELMLPYTNNKPRKRHAILAINMQGGGGFEIWQYIGREPQAPAFKLQAGDLGIFVTKIKSKDVRATFEWYQSEKLNLCGGLTKDPIGKPTFFVYDPYGNLFQIVEGTDWLFECEKLTGATYGAILGVSDMETSMDFYKKILGYDTIVYDQIGEFREFSIVPGGDQKFRRVLLTHSEARKGAFSPLFGSSYLELIQVLSRKPKKIFENRMWGDLGFIHLCFDIKRMDLLKKECAAANHPFTVESGGAFDMGEAVGDFSYIEDPDGTLIEFIETYKIPILKKLNIYLNLKNKKPEKPLPRWMLKGLAFNRVKIDH
ncbi:MAG: VOC family protein [Bacteroidetes bacterium]|nr:VOC family protein [Bacteroidota bacterium]